VRDDRERLLDILESIENIRKYALSGKTAFLENELIQVWIIHHVQIIGEAAGRLSPELRDKHHEIPWPDIISMRNTLVHHYFGMDLDLIWDTVERDIPNLRVQVEAILQSL